MAITDPIFRFSEEPGPFRVGLNVVEQYDYSRTYRHPLDALGSPCLEERARPLQTLVWYPADRCITETMTVGDYAKLLLTETTFGRPNPTVQAKEWFAAMQPALDLPMWSVRDAPPATGRFPLMVYAPSFSSMSWENADLCEYLASHGYVVVASPCMGTTTRNMTANLMGIEAQARDISFLIGYAQTLLNADVARVAVAGFSWGGISNLFAAARDNRIRALVALDGTLRYWPALVSKAGDVHPERMTIPLLYFAQGEITLEEIARYYADADGSNLNVLNAWHGDLLIARMLGFTHREHSSMFQRNEDFWKDAMDPDLPTAMKADYTRQDGITGYAWIVRYTLRFLNAYLKDDVDAKGFLDKSPAENGAPAHFMNVSYRRAEGLPASFDTFRSEIGRLGFDQAPEILARLEKKDAGFKLDEVAVNSWSEQLMSAEHLPEAISLLELNVRMHPGSTMAHLNLGKGLERSGKGPRAAVSYRKALEINPRNPEARRKLRALEGADAC